MNQDGARAVPARLDEAARAGWLYYVAGNTQDEIARKLNVSRQTVQRLVSLAVSEKLIKVWLDHPLARCMELAEALKARHGLQVCEVAPSDPEAPDLLGGIAIATAREIERALRPSAPRILSMGTGRAMRASVEEVQYMDCPQHKIVSRLGNVMSDGSASPFNVVSRLADRVGAPHYPMPLPVFAESAAERETLLTQKPVRHTLELCAAADMTFVGIGEIDEWAPMVKDGFVQLEELQALQAAGATGEITGWAFDAAGQLIPGALASRVASAPIAPEPARPFVGVATGPRKVAAIAAALEGRLINGLITSEATAEAVLAVPPARGSRTTA